VHDFGQFDLAIRFALLRGEFHHGVKLRELAVFNRQHACG
jgi:hypothetical protein